MASRSTRPTGSVPEATPVAPDEVIEFPSLEEIDHGEPMEETTAPEQPDGTPPPPTEAPRVTEEEVEQVGPTSFTTKIADGETKEDAAERLQEVADEHIRITAVTPDLTAFGRVLNLGETVEVKKGDVRYQGTVDRAGNTWLDLDEDAQIARWGKVKFIRT